MNFEPKIINFLKSILVENFYTEINYILFKIDFHFISKNSIKVLKNTNNQINILYTYKVIFDIFGIMISL